MISHNQIHEDQRQAARTMDDGQPFNAYMSRPKRPVAKIAPKGHEAFLKALESSRAEVTFEMAASGAIWRGPIKASDKYTVSIQEELGTRVLFKSDISTFYVDAPKAKTEAA